MHGPLNTREADQLRRLPVISRARGHHLYTIDGRRWTDCWADGGRLLEGHRPGGLGKRIKNEIDRGLYASYPNRWEGRLEKVLLSAFPGFTGVRIYHSQETAFEALGSDVSRDSVTDPLDIRSGESAGIHRVTWGRFLLPDHPAAELLLPIMPLSGLGEVQPVLFKAGCEPEAPSEIISPIVLAALTRAVLPLSSRDSGKLPFTTESTDIWERRGPYMLYRGESSGYQALFDTMFTNRILIAPSADRPSLFPASPSEKESRLILQGGRSE